MAFPLLCLPSVAFRIIVRLIDFDEIIKLGFCSEKSKSRVKHERVVQSSRKPILTMCLGRYSCILIQYLNDDGPQSLDFYSIDLSTLPSNQTIQYWSFNKIRAPVLKTSVCTYQTYWENQLVGLQTLVSYLTDFLNIQVHRLSISPTSQISDPRNAIDWLMSRQSSVHGLQLEGKCCDESELHYVLDKCKVTDKLYLSVPTRDSFQRNITVQLNTIILHYTLWLTIDHLLSMNSCVIVINETRFTNQDMNRFLKSWANGGHPRLRTVELQMEPIQFEELTDGLDGDIVRRREERPYVVSEEDTFRIGDSWDIQRDQVASIVKYGTEFGASKMFSMVVWPDFDGNRYDL
uniref:FBA_2 domain-containing protein n=1 Tax=Caenorhabditis tropicalis TaxID=1561998 RepID=A0A1I7UEP8_9PELO